MFTRTLTALATGAIAVAAAATPASAATPLRWSAETSKASTASGTYEYLIGVPERPQVVEVRGVLRSTDKAACYSLLFSQPDDLGVVQWYKAARLCGPGADRIAERISLPRGWKGVPAVKVCTRAIPDGSPENCYAETPLHR